MKINQLPRITEQSSQALGTLAVNEFMAAFQLSNYLEFFKMTGNVASARKSDADMQAGANRTIATDYTAKSNTPGFATANVKIYGDIVETDIAYERRGIDIGSQRSKDLANFSRSLGRYFMNSIINDTVSADKFSGLTEQCTTLNLKTVFDTVNGGALPSGNATTDKKQQDKFFEQLDFMIAQTNPTVLLCNSKLKARLASVGRSFLTVSSINDVYNQPVSINLYNGIPVIDAGFKEDNTNFVIGNAETEGTSTTCTSLYLLRCGEEIDWTFATNVGLDVKDLGLVSTKYQTLVEMDIDMLILNPNSVKRLSGIIL